MADIQKQLIVFDFDWQADLFSNPISGFNPFQGLWPTKIPIDGYLKSLRLICGEG
jgi:hypothetical protein